MAAFSTLDALTSLSTSIPEWNERLDELSSTINQRQVELARLTGDERPPTRSIKHKGSTESLRPQDNEEAAHDPYLSFDTPAKPILSSPNQESSDVAHPGDVITPPPSGTRSSPIELSRKPTQNTSRLGLRKRKTESMISAESQAPKYRTRSMIIVYYDSHVQSAFEDLVKFISASRNSMRKGKMNAKMEAMRRAAEREAEGGAEEEEVMSLAIASKHRSGSSTPQAVSNEQTKTASTTSPTPANPIAVDNDDSSSEVDLPPLQFVSTRNMGPPKTYGSGAGAAGRLSSSAIMSRGSRLGGSSAFAVNDIFDDLDKGLEWCQGQCERGAHQFLRDGDCSDEIEGIKKRLLEVKGQSEQEVERLRKEETENPKPAPQIKSRELRNPMMRKPALGDGKKPDPERARKIAEADNRKLEVGKMEVDAMEVDDDEGIEDLDLPPMLTFRRTRDMVR